jgi:uncharacterized protein YjbJ (UPF0337 family)
LFYLARSALETRQRYRPVPMPLSANAKRRSGWWSDCVRLQRAFPSRELEGTYEKNGWLAGPNGVDLFSDVEDPMMNKDIFEGQWKQVRGEAKAWWGKLTDDDLDRAAGKLDVFAGILQEKYGYSHQHAVEEINKHVTKYESDLKKKPEPAATSSS